MSVWAIVLAFLEGDLSGPTANWSILAVPVLIVLFSLTFPVNALAFLLMARRRQRPIELILIAILLGAVWFAVGYVISGDPDLLNQTSLWLGIGGLLFGLAVIAILRRDGAVEPA